MIKFLHLVCLLIFFVVFFVSRLSRSSAYIGENGQQVQCHQKTYTCSLILCMIFLLITLVEGMFLVSIKGYTFQTPWIQAAMLWSSVVLIYCVLEYLLFIYFKGKKLFSLKCLSVFRWIDGAIVLVLLVIMHDAVTKSTGLYHVIF